MSDNYDNAQNTENANPSKSDSEISDYSHISSPLLRRAFLFLEDGNFSEANKYCEKVLDQEPENAYAYLGKLMAELYIRQQKMLVDCKTPFDGNSNYIKAIRFGDEKLVAELKGYISGINERNMKSSADNNDNVEFSTSTFSGSDENEEDEEQDIYDMYYPSLIEKEVAFYQSKFSEMEAREKTYSWNWCAFLFVEYWFLYRKMYAYGFIFIGIDIVQSILSSAFGIIFSLIVSLVVHIFCGIFGNYMYYYHLNSKVNEISTMDENYSSQYIIKNGGTSILAVVLLLIVRFILVLI